MGVRGLRTDEQGYEKAQDGTIYWTLSLYIEPEKVALAAGLDEGKRVEPEKFRAVQRRHFPSLALANAIDPLMNDIADREMQGKVQEFLLAAIDDRDIVYDDLIQAGVAIRAHKDLTFTVPDSISWTTEGVKFHAHPEGLGDERAVRLRRFWLSHNNGALSYHLSFSHYYGGDYLDKTGQLRPGYDPSTYYFLSMLQKLAAPKEYALESTAANPDPVADVFGEADLDIDPLDKIRVRSTGLNAGALSKETKGEKFWPFVSSMFDEDAHALFARLTEQTGTRPKFGPSEYADKVLERVPFIEVPGLRVPKSRFMFMLHDKRFFDRLMPIDRGTKEAAPRKRMVQEGCFDAYQDRIRALMKPTDGRLPKAVHLGHPGIEVDADESADPDYWNWVGFRKDYDEALKLGFFARRNPNIAEDKLDSEIASHWTPIKATRTGSLKRKPGQHPLSDLRAAMLAGECFQRFAFSDGYPQAPGKVPLKPPVKRDIPTFEPGRPDCLDYLFLAGFNQNIIDFMNQDTSEILDSIDPIYPENDEQSDERFFVRYANHRAMITYVPRSRSLEIGNDYIGACPYAFLIHALALHNEFLARGHEHKTMERIEQIEALIAGGARGQDAVENLPAQRLQDEAVRLDQAEIAINEAKLAEFSQYERFRHANPFRYDTERDVFKTLEQLRGISRKQAALALAIKSLEDHASDLSRRQQLQADSKRRDEEQAKKDREDEAARQQKIVDDDAARRGVWLNILLGMTGFFGAGQMFYWIGEKTSGKAGGGPDHPTALATIVGHRGPSSNIGNSILAATEIVMTVTLVAFMIMLGKILWDARSQIFSPKRKPENSAGTTASDAPADVRRKS